MRLSPNETPLSLKKKKKPVKLIHILTCHKVTLPDVREMSMKVNFI